MTRRPSLNRAQFGGGVSTDVIMEKSPPRWRKSAPGHSRRSDYGPATSGQPRTADIIRPARLARFVPTVDIAGVSFWIFAPIANRLKRRPELTVNT
jgi:hypothetical protein